MTAVWPEKGTDNYRVARALVEAFPGAAWDLRSRLDCTANSRVDDLRHDFGWPIGPALSKPREGTRRRSWGYALEYVPACALEAVQAPYAELDGGQLRIA